MCKMSYKLLGQRMDVLADNYCPEQSEKNRRAYRKAVAKLLDIAKWTEEEYDIFLEIRIDDKTTRIIAYNPDFNGFWMNLEDGGEVEPMLGDLIITCDPNHQFLIDYGVRGINFDTRWYTIHGCPQQILEVIEID